MTTRPTVQFPPGESRIQRGEGLLDRHILLYYQANHKGSHVLQLSFSWQMIKCGECVRFLFTCYLSSVLYKSWFHLSWRINYSHDTWQEWKCWLVGKMCSYNKYYHSVRYIYLPCLDVMALVKYLESKDKYDSLLSFYHAFNVVAWERIGWDRHQYANLGM